MQQTGRTRKRESKGEQGRRVERRVLLDDGVWD